MSGRAYHFIRRSASRSSLLVSTTSLLSCEFRLPLNRYRTVHIVSHHYRLVGLLIMQSLSGIILARNEVLLANHPVSTFSIASGGDRWRSIVSPAF